MFILRFIERSTPAIITALFGYQLIKLCSHFENKWKFEREYLKIFSAIPLYFFYMFIYVRYNNHYRTKVLKRLSHMKLSGKC